MYIASLGVWHWPQFTLAIVFFIHLIIHAKFSGKPMMNKEGEIATYNFPMAFCRVIFFIFVLAMGGFFGKGI